MLIPGGYIAIEVGTLEAAKRDAAALPRLLRCSTLLGHSTVWQQQALLGPSMSGLLLYLARAWTLLDRGLCHRLMALPVNADGWGRSGGAGGDPSGGHGGIRGRQDGGRLLRRWALCGGPPAEMM